MRDALHRAAIFLGYAFHTSKHVPLRSISLNAVIELDVGVPDPIPPVDRQNYQTAFSQWAIGQGLIELDQSFHRYMVSALDTLAGVNAFLNNQQLPGAGNPRLANTWSVYEEFYLTFGQKSSEHVNVSGYLRSLGNARNCLAHDSGIVSRRRINDGYFMLVRWPGRDIIMIDQNGGRTVLPRDRGFRASAEHVGSQLSVEECVRERHYLEGDRVALSQTDLAEIISFYQTLAMEVSGQMHQVVGQKLAAANG